MNYSWLYETVIDFSTRTLPKEKWTHKAHILVAFWHNWYLNYDEAYENVKKKISDYNEAVGVQNSDTSGYHDSITIFWLIVTRNFITENRFESVDDACMAFLESNEADRDYPLEYYSTDFLFSLQAREGWLPPDKKALEKKFTH